MTESKKRKFHPPELKDKVGLEAIGGMNTINQICAGIWGPSGADRLYGEIGRLKMELDWLKKKSGISLP